MGGIGLPYLKRVNHVIGSRQGAERLAGGEAKPRSGVARTTGPCKENIPIQRCMPKVCEKHSAAQRLHGSQHDLPNPPACAFELEYIVLEVREAPPPPHLSTPSHTQPRSPHPALHTSSPHSHHAGKSAPPATASPASSAASGSPPAAGSDVPSAPRSQ